MSKTLDAQAIKNFMEGQVACWNAHDREGFLGWYHRMAADSLVIGYAGRADTRDGWVVLEEMFDKHNARVVLEVVEIIINGHEVAAHHRNRLVDGDLAIESIETYRFSPGRLSVCYFLKPPASEDLDLKQFRDFAAEPA